MISITLITCDCDPLAKARLTVFKTLLDPPKISINMWPSKGVELEGLDLFRDTTEFWVTPEAEQCVVLRFGDKDKEVFKVSNIKTWGWFLNRTYPCASFRFLPRFGALKNILTQDAEDFHYSFKLSVLKQLFHDMRSCEEEHICRKTAKWLASLDNPILRPFEFIKSSNHWRKWESEVSYRKTRANILVDGDSNVINGESMYFWQQICEQYQKWAGDKLSEQEYSDLESKLVELTNKW